MSNITLDKLFDLLLEGTPVGEEVNVHLRITKRKEGGWDIEYYPPAPSQDYKIEPKKESRNDSSTRDS